METMENITLFDEAEETTFVIDFEELFQTKAADENRIHLLRDQEIKTQAIEQNPNCATAFLSPYELFWKGFATFVSPSLAYRIPF